MQCQRSYTFEGVISPYFYSTSWAVCGSRQFSARPSNYLLGVCCFGPNLYFYKAAGLISRLRLDWNPLLDFLAWDLGVECHLCGRTFASAFSLILIGRCICLKRMDIFMWSTRRLLLRLNRWELLGLIVRFSGNHRGMLLSRWLD